MDARVPTTMPETTMTSPSGSGLVVPPERRPLRLSPINRRRWQNFKRNRRGFYALWVFLFLFVTSLFAEVIANDKPFMIQ
jgi:microcin C transport system permease protein